MVGIDCTGVCGGGVSDCSPTITEIIDTPDDQGFFVTLSFSASAAESSDSESEFYLIQRYDMVDVSDISDEPLEEGEWNTVDSIFVLKIWQ